MFCVVAMFVARVHAPVEVLSSILSPLKHEPAAVVGLHVAVHGDGARRVRGRHVVYTAVCVSSLFQLVAVCATKKNEFFSD